MNLYKILWKDRSWPERVTQVGIGFYALAYMAAAIGCSEGAERAWHGTHWCDAKNAMIDDPMTSGNTGLIVLKSLLEAGAVWSLGRLGQSVFEFCTGRKDYEEIEGENEGDSQKGCCQKIADALWHNRDGGTIFAVGTIAAAGLVFGIGAPLSSKIAGAFMSAMTADSTAAIVGKALTSAAGLWGLSNAYTHVMNLVDGPCTHPNLGPN